MSNEIANFQYLQQNGFDDEQTQNSISKNS
jgi:hypothetical protein